MTNDKNIPRLIILGSKSFIAKSIIKNLQSKIEVLEISRDEIDFSNKKSSLKLHNYISDHDSILFIAAKAPVKNTEMLIYNIEICQNICDVLVNYKLDHVSYISSDAVYKDSDKELSEKSPAEPSSLHGLMHLTREKILESYFYEILCIIRPTLIYGDNDPHNGYGPNMFIRRAKNKEDIYLFGKGEEKRDHVWIEDVAEISSNLIIDRYNGIVNITSGKVISFFEIANLIQEKYISLKINFLERELPMPHKGYRAFNNDKIKSLYKDFNFKALKDWISE